MNAYERRKLAREQHVRNIQRTNKALKEIAAESFIDKFIQAWKDATGITIKLFYRDGWYVFNNKRRSRTQLLGYLAYHEAAQHAQELGE